MALVQIEGVARWKQLLGYVGPGFLVSVAYLDPGNLQTDLQAGAEHKFELLWIVLVGLAFALIIQSLSANLGVATGKHLSEHCKLEYPRRLNYCLWILAEVAVIAADIPEVIGTAFGMHILFKVPIWCGVLLTGVSTLLLLGLQRYGIRKLELMISIMILVVGGCFFAEMARSKPDAAEIAKGMFVPRLAGNGAARDAVALFGALVMPHNLFLHSALVISRKIPHTYNEVRRACRNFLIESAIALLLAFLINVSVVSVTGTVCFSPGLTTLDKASCESITLESAASLLENVLGKWSSEVYAVSLLASGQSSMITGTYAGQYIMQGFLELRMKAWLRNLLTRSIAIAPSLVFSTIGGASGAGKLIIIASMILAFELPFALIPLLRFTSSEAKMGYHKNSLPVTIVSWALGGCLIGINTYFLGSSVVGWLAGGQLPRAASILVAVAILPLLVVYLGLLLYLTLRKERWAPFAPLSAVSMNSAGPVREQNGAEGPNSTSNEVGSGDRSDGSSNVQLQLQKP